MNFLILRIGYPCPELFNPADHFIYKMSMVPREEDEYEQRVDYICEQFQSSKYCESSLAQCSCLYVLVTYELLYIAAKILSSEIDSHIHDRFCNEDFSPSHLNNPYKSSWTQQFRAVFWRSWSAAVKDPKVATIRTIEAIVRCLNQMSRWQIHKISFRL